MLDRVAQGFQLSYETFKALRLSDQTRALWDILSFGMGFVGFHNLLESYYFKDRNVEDIYRDFPQWQQTAFKVSDCLSNISLILGGVTSRPAVSIWSWSAQALLTPEQLAKFFGSQGLIPADQAHRNLTLLAFLLGVPYTLKTIYVIYTWVNYSQVKTEEEKPEKQEEDLHEYAPLPLLKEDVFVTMKTVSETAQHLLLSPHK
jgi:hypothetical protein